MEKQNMFHKNLRCSFFTLQNNQNKDTAELFLSCYSHILPRGSSLFSEVANILKRNYSLENKRNKFFYDFLITN